MRIRNVIGNVMAWLGLLLLLWTAWLYVFGTGETTGALTVAGLILMAVGMMIKGRTRVIG